MFKFSVNILDKSGKMETTDLKVKLQADTNIIRHHFDPFNSMDIKLDKNGKLLAIKLPKGRYL